MAHGGALVRRKALVIIWTLQDGLDGRLHASGQKIKFWATKLTGWPTSFCYGLMFRAAWQTLQAFAKDEKCLGANAGATMVLHTWGQNLMLHPHVHAIVPSGGLDGGLDGAGNWVVPKKGHGKAGFLFPVKAMSKVFRAVFLKAFRKAWNDGALVLPPSAPTKKVEIRRWLHLRHRQAWVVYAKAPFGGPESVIEYLGRYTHKTAISNHSLLDRSGGKVTFRYKD